jgi:glutaconate CoA-transferase subunit A
MPPAYGWDMKAFKSYADAAREPGDWTAVADRFVGATEAAYLESIGGKEAVAALPLPIF